MAGCVGGAGPPAQPLTAAVSPAAPGHTPTGARAAAATDAPPARPSPDAPRTPDPRNHPAGSRYTSGDRGYDLSYPQCVSADRPPAGARFAVVGINNGKAFTVNPCLARQLRQSATVARAVYVNSGYNPDNQSRASRACVDLGERVEGTPDQQTAYAIGCAEAEHATAAFHAAGAFTPTVWWIDVENSNSWDEEDLNLNRYSLQGLIDRLGVEGSPVGIYSTFREWRVITGSWQVGVAANWVAGRSPAAACAGPGFTGSPVWLAQELETWPDGLDSDWAC